MYKITFFRPLYLVIALPLLLIIACGDGEAETQQGFDVGSELVTEAEFPAVFTFTPDGRLFYNELLTGNVRVITADGDLLEEPFAHVDLALQGPGSGLLGLAIDPEFESNHYVYIYFTAPTEGSLRPIIMRFTDVDNRGEDPTVILDDLHEHDPGLVRHVGGNVHFGPDGYLYVTIGEMDDMGSSQDLSSARGKILRVKTDGDAVPDNPFVDQPGADPRVFAYGMRNSFDFTFHPQTGQIYANENGDASCDELNLVVKGGNYGWPQSSEPPPLDGLPVCQNAGANEAIHYFLRPPEFAEEGRSAALRPAHVFSTVAPTGVEFISRSVYPTLGDSLLICEFNTGFMRRYWLEGPDQDIVQDGSIVLRDCNLDIVLDSEGIVYYSNAEEIRRLRPAE